MKVWIGYDKREVTTLLACEKSIVANSPGVQMGLLVMEDLRAAGLYSRPDDPLASTDFAWTRFLIPRLQHYRGWAMFCDCDFIFTQDLNKLFALADDRYAVMAVKHPAMELKESVKMDGKKQEWYERKWWSSLVLWNCGHPANAMLTPEVVNSPIVKGRNLHAFGWLHDKHIGELPATWNWLEGYSDPLPGDVVPAGIHFTRGSPQFAEYKNAQYADIWRFYAS